jgi:hypothetical protein
MDDVRARWLTVGSRLLAWRNAEVSACCAPVLLLGRTRRLERSSADARQSRRAVPQCSKCATRSTHHALLDDREAQRGRRRASACRVSGGDDECVVPRLDLLRARDAPLEDDPVVSSGAVTSWPHPETLASGANRKSTSRVEPTRWPALRGSRSTVTEAGRAASRLVDVYDLASVFLRLAFDASLDGQAR